MYEFSGPGAERSIFSVQSDGTNWRELTDNGSEPAWSPDGSQIAFVRDENNTSYLYVMNADGSNERPVTQVPFLYYAPAWSPDGNQIAYAGRSGWRDDADVYILDLTTGIQRNLTDNVDIDDSDPAWSPDGSSIAITSNRFGTNAIYFLDPVTGNVLGQLQTATLPVARPHWSPDGLSIAFTGGGLPGGTFVFSQRIGSDTAVQLTNEGEARSFDWIDNETILYLPALVDIVEIRTATGLAVPSTVRFNFIPGSITSIDVFIPSPVEPTPTPPPTATPNPDIVFTQGSYRAVQRVGNPRVFIERALAAGLDPFDSDPVDGWTLVGRTNGAGDNGTLRAFTVIDAVPYAAIQHTSKGCIVVTPVSLAPRLRGQTRLVTIIEQGNGSRCQGDWALFPPG
ncbi:MAG: hypothetical protein SF162_20570 [bacterium]|nr:hypothetical protein [bacterium]